MSLFSQRSQQQQQAFQGFNLSSLLGGGQSGQAIGDALSAFRSQQLFTATEGKPKEKIVTFYSRLKEEVTDWLKISI